MDIEKNKIAIIGFNSEKKIKLISLESEKNKTIQKSKKIKINSFLNNKNKKDKIIKTLAIS